MAKPKDLEPGSENQSQEPQPAEETHIWVVSNRNDDSVVVFEKADEHPSGEAYVARPAGPVKVGKTPEVLRKLANSELRRISDTEATQWRTELAAAKRQARYAALVEEGVPENEAAKKAGLTAP
jgi:hypothetical protein